MIRFFDVFISISILIIFLPVLILIPILIIIFDGSPVIFKQVRVGLNGKKFNIFKFRTMKNTFYKNEILRLTFLGKILRKTSLDEMPQFINILKNEMSIVGPRPLPEKIEKKIKNTLRKKRRTILPGITGMSQVNFTGKNRTLSEKINLDIKLVNNYNLYNYFKIMLNTPIILIIKFFKNKSSIVK